MPFTPAHPAIVLPFLNLDRRYVSATGLIVGSVAPDFEYFLKLSVDGVHGHTFWGLFYFDIPIATLIAVVFQQVVKTSLIRNLPHNFQQRLTDLYTLDFRTHLATHPWAFLCCAWLGAASHVFWDAFTHNGTYVTQRLAIYNHGLELFGTRYPMFFLLQHASTVVGIAVILIYFFRRPRDRRPFPGEPSLRYWIVLGVITFATPAIRFVVYAKDYNLGNVVVTFMSGIFAGLIICGFIDRWRVKDRGHFG